MKGKVCCLLFMSFWTIDVSATELIYTPVNPNFGGSPLNGSYLLAGANAINDYKPPQENSLLGEDESSIQRLAANLESRLIGQLLSDVGNGNTGQLSTDDFLLNIVDNNGSLMIQVTDKATGETSTIQVSGLVPDM
ncbi:MULTISPECIES: curli assembly protein CsgF [Photobacterium]|mgnify:CR=1 FL=1|nr:MULTISPECIES: curli assembly protein CsgF [Photobacterium]UIP26962.1 curli production assembly protein CsgF [Photobacterium sp. TLY01]